MKKVITLLLLLPALALSAQGFEDEKEDIAVLPFSGWQGYNADEYERIITKKILSQIIASKKFNVITVDDDELKQIASELRLQLSGMVDEETAVEVGYRRGVNKFIVGNFTGNSVEYHRARYDDGELEEHEYYTTNLRATIKLLDIETGKYIESTEASAYGKSRSERGAINTALDRLANDIVARFKKYFMIQAWVSGVNTPEIILDRGAEMGIKEGMTFEVYDIRKPAGDRPHRDMEIPVGAPVLGVAKITEVTASSARALLMGRHEPVGSGLLVREMREKATTSANIVRKTLNRVTLDRGANFEISPGQYYTVVKAVKNSRNLGRTKKVGLIYIDDVTEDRASGRILNGRYAFRNEMMVEQTRGTHFSWGASIAWGQAFQPEIIQPNAPSGSYTVDNGEPGAVTVGSDYLASYDPLQRAEMYSITGHFRDMLYNYTISFGTDYLSIGGGELSAWVPKLGASYQIALVPEVLYLSPGVEVGMGYMQQNIDAVNKISGEKRDYVRDWSPMFAGTLEGMVQIKSLQLFAKVAWQQLTFKNWKYRANTGEYDDDGNAETKAYRIPAALVPYPQVRTGPLFMQAGIRIDVPGSF